MFALANIEVVLLGGSFVVGLAVFYLLAVVYLRLKDFNNKIQSLEKTFEVSLQQSKNDSVMLIGQMVGQNFQIFAEAQKNQLAFIQKQIGELEKLNEMKFDSIRNAVNNQLENIQKQTSDKLEKIRATVEEKLHDTLEKRLGTSFKMVSDQLEQVYKGLGEMQTIAAGVGDLKKVLSNVKTRGIWGELQLENIIEHILTPDQYEKNVEVIPGSSSRVEFAIKIPNKTDKDHFIWLPIDAKFPIESYYKLLQASENHDQDVLNASSKELETQIKLQAKIIAEKYLMPPHTADFAIMFLPIEALYAEVLKKPGIIESLQRDYKVIITGPTTLSAILNSLQMGFRTLAIEQRSHEVWRILSSVKSEFSKFSAILVKTKHKLDQASKDIEHVETRTRAMQRQLRNVESTEGATEIAEGIVEPLLEETKEVANSNE